MAYARAPYLPEWSAAGHRHPERSGAVAWRRHSPRNRVSAPAPG